jgi:hypothetical protein
MIGKPLFPMMLNEVKAIALLSHILESCGVRKTARMFGVNKNIVMRYSHLTVQCANAIHDELMTFFLKNH